MLKNESKTDLLDKTVSLCKRRGFVFPGSEIYGGLSGFWDYGHYGLALKENIKQLWWKQFVLDREDMFGMDAAILMRQEVWQASGHAKGFADPMVECEKCKKQYKADQQPTTKCPECDGKLGKARQFNMMFKTHVGAEESDAAVS
ncbi:MAG: Glycine-tRNA ligase [Candidatus Magasanikbacteria bacterium GW2011_GWA2_46_17]|uniref:Glycine-tRNA ligase n=1 Tax=Candidatus Magasanikbacteria bacterium GW2011_GWA2_46_17 TaxID=1619042 RepID=A0A0G1NXZ6_9BACT|nr:MAG: Glycine-tRNA ligase [Candidatus Magasanikbacteria bacterium GW2011_GWA2_46_17]